MCKLPRMRGVNEAYLEVKKLDPDTALTKTYIRNLAKQGKIRTVFAGNRMLINIESLIEFLSTDSLTERKM